MFTGKFLNTKKNSLSGETKQDKESQIKFKKVGVVDVRKYFLTNKKENFLNKLAEEVMSLQTYL